MANNGEIMALIATTNRFKKYMERDKWARIELLNLDIFLTGLDNYSLSHETKEHNAQTKTLYGNKIKFYDSEKYNIWNVVIRVYITDHINFMDDLLKHEISLLISGSTVATVPMLHNLFIAKFLHRELIEGPNYVDIPVILPELIYPEKFPLYTLYDGDLTFILEQKSNLTGPHVYTNVNEVHFDYEQVFKSPQINEVGMISVVQSNFVGFFKVDQGFSRTHPNCNKSNTIYNLSLHHVCKLLFFEFLYYEVDEPILESVILYLNEKPITYSASDGTIINATILDKSIYAISLTPEFMIEDDMHKLFSVKRSVLQKGIDFSRIDNIKIRFEFDQEYPDLYVNVSSVACNLFMNFEGKGGMRYSS